jgi:hypothetical protein
LLQQRYIRSTPKNDRVQELLHPLEVGGVGANAPRLQEEGVFISLQQDGSLPTFQGILSVAFKQ